MTLKRTAYVSYYSLIGCILIAQVVYTLFQTSLVVGHGRHAEDLQKRQQELALEQSQLQATLSTQLSLTQLTADQLAAYTPITAPLMVQAAPSLAAAQ